MAKAVKKSNTGKKPGKRKKADKGLFRPVRWLIKWSFRAGLVVVSLSILLVLAYAIFNPPTTPYMISEGRRLGSVDHQWVELENIAPVMARSVVAAEDANFCNHWGFDMAAIRDALEDGSGRGASTISQQVVKNAYLWQGRSWPRKAMEALITPVLETIWSKRRILEVYLNVAEFGEGVFGVEAAARTYFRVGPDKLTPVQAARLAATLPNPKKRSAKNPSRFIRKRSASIVDGAQTILVDGRAACFSKKQ